MVEIKGSALCQICSGRSNTFFRDNNALISKDTCQEAVFKCKGFFKGLRAFVEDFKQVYNLMATQTEDTVIFKKINEVNQALIGGSPPDHMMNDFALLESANQNDKTALLAKVCSRFVNMHESTVIGRLDFDQRLSAPTKAILASFELYINRANYMLTKTVGY